MNRSENRSDVFLAAATLLSVGALANRSAAQDVLLEIQGSSATNPLSQGAVIGDWNGDGTSDVAIASRYDDTIANDAGAVHVQSGTDGSILHSWFGAMADDYFGIPYAFPDVDGDGDGEVLVLDLYSDIAGKDAGSAFLFAGGTGTQLWRVDGTKLLGFQAAPVKDIDGDGAPEAAISELGALHVLSGATGTLLFSITGAPANDFGYATAVLGDVDADGYDDFLIGAARANGGGFNRGRAVVYTGRTQAVLHTHVGTVDTEHLGFSVAALGDVDGDTIPDYAILSEHEDAFTKGKDDAIVRVHSGATFTLLGDFTTVPSEYFLFPRIDPTGDVNGDGVQDFAVLGNNSGGTWAPLLVSGRTLSVLYSFEHLETMGFVTGAAGDFDGDGLGDLLAAAPYTGSGRFRVYDGDDLWLNARPHSPKAGQTLVLATREGVPANLTVLAIVGVDGIPAFQVVNGLGAFGADGGRTISASVPAGLSGHTISLQSFADDASGHVIDTAVETIDFQ